MNSELKVEISIILESLNKIKNILEREPKVKLFLWCVYYGLKLGVWGIKLVK